MSSMTAKRTHGKRHSGTIQRSSTAFAAAINDNDPSHSTLFAPSPSEPNTNVDGVTLDLTGLSIPISMAMDMASIPLPAADSTSQAMDYSSMPIPITLDLLGSESGPGPVSSSDLSGPPPPPPAATTSSSSSASHRQQHQPTFTVTLPSTTRPGANFSSPLSDSGSAHSATSLTQVEADLAPAAGTAAANAGDDDGPSRPGTGRRGTRGGPSASASVTSQSGGVQRDAVELSTVATGRSKRKASHPTSTPTAPTATSTAASGPVSPASATRKTRASTSHSTHRSCDTASAAAAAALAIQQAYGSAAAGPGSVAAMAAAAAIAAAEAAVCGSPASGSATPVGGGDEAESPSTRTKRIYRRRDPSEILPCPHCTKTYTGHNARSVLRRHVSEKHRIGYNLQPRSSRWDRDPNRPRDDRERRARVLESKRNWAKRNRMGKKGEGEEEGTEREAKRLQQQGEFEASAKGNNAAQQHRDVSLDPPAPESAPGLSTSTFSATEAATRTSSRDKAQTSATSLDQTAAPRSSRGRGRPRADLNAEEAKWAQAHLERLQQAASTDVSSSSAAITAAAAAATQLARTHAAADQAANRAALSVARSHAAADAAIAVAKAAQAAAQQAVLAATARAANMQGNGGEQEKGEDMGAGAIDPSLDDAPASGVEDSRGEDARQEAAAGDDHEELGAADEDEWDEEDEEEIAEQHDEIITTPRPRRSGGATASTNSTPSASTSAFTAASAAKSMACSLCGKLIRGGNVEAKWQAHLQAEHGVLISWNGSQPMATSTATATAMEKAHAKHATKAGASTTHGTTSAQDEMDGKGGEKLPSPPFLPEHQQQQHVASTTTGGTAPVFAATDPVEATKHVLAALAAVTGAQPVLASSSNAAIDGDETTSSRAKRRRRD